MVRLRCTLFILLTAVLVLAATKRVSSQSQKPNIIFILGDDIGYNLLGANGGHRYATPNLDKMAAEGMRFTQCHSAPLCSPSRFMLLTGKYNFRNYTQWGVLDQSQKTVANLFKNAGYTTACYGKWQMGGGSSSIRTFGFDNYSVVYPFTPDPDKASIYKNPVIYENDHFLPAGQTNNKYGEDIFCDSVFGFIDRNKSNPFFIYYPMVLAHRPFNPTPDDPAFASWNSLSTEDTVYYPSMIQYMDKKIGQVIAKVKSLHIENNTLIVFAGDNGTPTPIKDYSDSGTVSGEKGKPTEYGTHVPLIAFWPGTVAPGSVNSDLIDFTDILPTFAKIANLTVPGDLGKLDGVDFSPRLTGQDGTPRSWIFDHYNPKLNNIGLTRWSQTTTYKLVEFMGKKRFYNLITDKGEGNPIPEQKLTAEEVEIKAQLQGVLNMYAAQSAPILFSPGVSNITETSAVLSAVVADEVLSPVKERGTIYHDTVFDHLAFNHPLAEGGTSVSAFAQKRDPLSPQHKYYFRGYAFNSNDTGYSPMQSFYTLSAGVISGPAVFTASPAPNSILAQWSPAVFPSSNANNRGYLLIYSDKKLPMPPVINGLSPTDIIKYGTWVQLPSVALPDLPDTFAVVSGLKAKTKYHFLLIPYTWDGINPATYHYFTEGAKMSSSFPGAIQIQVSPNPSTTNFKLHISTNSTERIFVTVSDMLGKKIYTTSGSSADTFTVGTNLNAGMYFVSVVQGLSSQTEKIIKGK